jgi:hypothetical protein
MEDVLHRIDLLRTALKVKGVSPSEIEETLSAIRSQAEPAAFESWNSRLSAMDRFVMARMLSPGGESLCGKYLLIFARTFITRFNLAPESIERWFKARLWGRN